MVPNLQPKILEERPPETPVEIQAIEQVSIELKSHMKQELIDHFLEMLQKQYGIKPKQQSCMYRTLSIFLRSDIVPSKIQSARFHQVLWAR
jgi:hypothetical protein